MKPLLLTLLFCAFLSLNTIAQESNELTLADETSTTYSESLSNATKSDVAPVKKIKSKQKPSSIVKNKSNKKRAIKIVANHRKLIDKRTRIASRY